MSESRAGPPPGGAPKQLDRSFFPAWTRTLRFRLTLLYSVMLFGVAAIVVGGIYWGLSRSIEQQVTVGNQDRIQFDIEQEMLEFRRQVELEDASFPAAEGAFAYYARAIQEPTLAVNAGGLRCQELDENGSCVEVEPCYADERTSFEAPTVMSTKPMSPTRARMSRAKLVGVLVMTARGTLAFCRAMNVSIAPGVISMPSSKSSRCS